MKYKQILGVALASLVFALLATACGVTKGDPIDTAGDAEHARDESPSENGMAEIVVVSTEFAFDPSTLTVTEGEVVNIRLENEGTLEHSIEIVRYGLHLHTSAGGTATGSFTPPEPGTYKFICMVAGHEELGMVGEIVVEAAK